jgi:hypothetical protein
VSALTRSPDAETDFDGTVEVTGDALVLSDPEGLYEETVPLSMPRGTYQMLAQVSGRDESRQLADQHGAANQAAEEAGKEDVSLPEPVKHWTVQFHFAS